MPWIYAGRASAGRVLAAQLSQAEVLRGGLVAAIGASGLPVAWPIASALGAELTLLGTSAGPATRGRTVVLVADGMATGARMTSAVTEVRRRGACRVVVVVPIAAERAIDALLEVADDVVCPVVPEPFGSVGAWYRSFPRVGDAEVRAILGAASPADAPPRPV